MRRRPAWAGWRLAVLLLLAAGSPGPALAVELESVDVGVEVEGQDLAKLRDAALDDAFLAAVETVDGVRPKSAGEAARRVVHVDILAERVGRGVYSAELRVAVAPAGWRHEAAAPRPAPGGEAAGHRTRPPAGEGVEVAVPVRDEADRVSRRRAILAAGLRFMEDVESGRTTGTLAGTLLPPEGSAMEADALLEALRRAVPR